MPQPKPEKWALQYQDPRSSKSMLFSLPVAMHEDLMRVAKAMDISASELLRRALTRELRSSGFPVVGAESELS